MQTSQRNFDVMAASWDEKPQRVRLATEVAEAICREVRLTPDMNGLDFGCGTGLLTLRLQPYLRTIIGADSSRGMLEALNAKIAASGLDNVCSMHCDCDPAMGKKIHGKYHLIVSSMTLHHVEAIAPLLVSLHAALLPEGILCLADLDSDGGRFHDDPTGVFHQGFARDDLIALLREVGFTEVSATTATTIDKPAVDGSTNRFSLFLITARK